MFNLGFPELLALGALALIVIGPKQLPEVAKVLARTINELKRATKDLSGTLVDVKSDIRSGVDGIKDELPSLDDIEKKISQYVDESDASTDIAEDEHDEHDEEENV